MNRRLTCPDWCAQPPTCTAHQPGGTHRSHPFRLPLGDSVTTAHLWALPTSVANPTRAMYLTLVDQPPGLGAHLTRPTRVVDRRRERRTSRQALRRDLAAVNLTARRAAA